MFGSVSCPHCVALGADALLAEAEWLEVVELWRLAVDGTTMARSCYDEVRCMDASTSLQPR